jgi:hypothetical protein
MLRKNFDSNNMKKITDLLEEFYSDLPELKSKLQACSDLALHLNHLLYTTAVLTDDQLDLLDFVLASLDQLISNQTLNEDWRSFMYPPSPLLVPHVATLARLTRLTGAVPLSLPLTLPVV